MRNVECGLRNGSAPVLGPMLCALAVLLISCNPGTTRPDFRPFPEAPSARLLSARERVMPVLGTLVTAESLRVRRNSTIDGYLETDWYDVRTHRSYRDGRHIPDLANTVKLRCWADPYVPSQTILTVEAVFRPRYDPSRIERELEVLVPLQHQGRALVDSLLKRARERFGSPQEESSP
jgi:hypothetical protein